MTVRVTGPKSALGFEPQTLLGRIDHALQQEARAAGQDLLTAVRAAEPVRTGQLRAQTRLRVSKTPQGWKIAVAVSKRERHIAKWVEAGTGIYGPRHKPIRPRKAKAFRLPGGHEARSVRGQRPQRPFERTAPALQAAERAMTQAAGRIIDQAVREANHGP